MLAALWCEPAAACEVRAERAYVEGVEVRAGATSFKVGFDQQVWVPCREVTLAETAELPPLPTAIAAPRGHAAALGSALVPLRSRPRAEPALNVSYLGAVEVLERREGWASVRARWSDGSELNGWLEAS